jgi:hypothetical protein
VPTIVDSSTAAKFSGKPSAPTSGGTAPAAQTAPYVPSTGAAQGNAMTDPTYQAYLRGMGVDQSEIQNILGTRVGALTRQLGRTLPAYADQKQQALKETGQGYESRGFYRSGNRMDEQARVGREQDRTALDFEAGIRDQIAELYGVSAMDLARLQREQTEQAMAAQQAATIAAAQAGIY